MRQTEPSDGSVSLRSARADDESAIRRLVLSERLMPVGLNWRRFMVLVDHHGEVVGCGQVKRHRAGFDELASLVVTPAWRGTGQGRRLIKALLAAADGDLWLMCRSSLVPLYEKFGFNLVGVDATQPSYFQRIRRLASLFEMLSQQDEYLAVMFRRREPGD